jgi:hypothetical protein
MYVETEVVMDTMILILASLLTVTASLSPVRADGGPSTAAAQDGGVPEPPREWVNTSVAPSSGRTLRVDAGGDLQDALEEAQLGDDIVLEAGAVFHGPFSLPNKRSGTGWITIRSSAVEKGLPPAGTRVSPSDASRMAVLTSGRGGGVILAERGAHHYRLIGLEVRPEPDTFLYSLLWLGNNKERSIDELPHHIVVDRCFLHGDPRKGTRRGVALNGRYLAVVDSHLSDFKEAGADSQAIIGWSGTGPFKIVNNYLEGAAENILFGGGDPGIRDVVPSDIEIRHNYMTKPLAWKRGEPNYDGSSWSVKNLFELKNARRVVVDGNILEYNWEESQSGFAVLFTVRNQDGKAPWSTIQDVQFTNNIVRHSGSGITLMAHDNNRERDQSVQMRRILIKNNIWEDIGGSRWGGKGILFQLRERTADVAIERNTGRQTGYLLQGEDPPHLGLRFVENVAPLNEWGIVGPGIAGTRAITAMFPGAVVVHNVFAGGDEKQYPPGNHFLSGTDALPFDKSATLRGSLSEEPAQPAGGTGKAGADIGVLCQALGPLRVRERMCLATSAAAVQHPSATP